MLYSSKRSKHSFANDKQEKQILDYLVYADKQAILNLRNIQLTPVDSKFSYKESSSMTVI